MTSPDRPTGPAVTSTGPPWTGSGASLDALADELRGVLASMSDFEHQYRTQLDGVHARQRRGACNLVDYLALRQTDTRRTTMALRQRGLAGIVGIEAHARASVAAVLDAVAALRADPPGTADPGRRPTHPSIRTGGARIRRQATRLLGPKRNGASTRIMVTMPTEAADDYDLVRGMVEAGMNVARVNCAHDDREVWLRMIENVRAAGRELDRPVRVFMDLAGPKIRIGAIEPGPRVVRVRPKLDERGMVIRPARISITSADGPALPDSDARVPVTGDVAARLRSGARLELADTRGEIVRLDIEEVSEGAARASSDRAFWIETGARVMLRGSDGSLLAEGAVGELPGLEARLHLRDGDVLTLHADPRPGTSPVPADAPGGPSPGHVSCTLPEVVEALRPGQPVFISDGAVRAEVIATREGEVDVRVVRSGPDGARIKGFKGLNVPETDLRLHGLTAKDREDLAFVVEHADGVNVSFLNHPDDVEDLLDELERAGGSELGVVLKIETRGAVRHLPAMLLAALEWPTVGVMVARGDLAIEVGWIELAEVIEEILMVCEAAHVPTIWATEVLSRLAKKGIPARGEVSDVVMAGRTECVMLNKGPFIQDVIRGLAAVLTRLQAYRDKRTTWLPELRLDLPDPEEVGRGVGDRLGRWR